MFRSRQYLRWFATSFLITFAALSVGIAFAYHASAGRTWAAS